jgi:hypothetical protein
MTARDAKRRIIDNKANRQARKELRTVDKKLDAVEKKAAAEREGKP